MSIKSFLEVRCARTQVTRFGRIPAYQFPKFLLCDWLQPLPVCVETVVLPHGSLPSRVRLLALVDIEFSPR